MNDLLSQLTGGDRRSIGASNAVVQEVLREPQSFLQIIASLSDKNRLIRIRCADAAEKITRIQPGLLRFHKHTLIEAATHSTEQELRWHLAQMLPRLDLSPGEAQRVKNVLFAYLDDKSRIVQTFALQALADLSVRDPALRARLLPLLKKLSKTGSPAVRARARKLSSDLNPSIGAKRMRRSHR